MSHDRVHTLILTQHGTSVPLLRFWTAMSDSSDPSCLPLMYLSILVLAMRMNLP